MYLHNNNKYLQVNKKPQGTQNMLQYNMHFDIVGCFSRTKYLGYVIYYSQIN